MRDSTLINELQKRPNLLIAGKLFTYNNSLPNVRFPVCLHGDSLVSSVILSGDNIKLKWMKLLKFILLTFATSLFSFTNQPLSGKVISVIDGNIIEILTDDGDKLLIKLSEVDSPELGQEFGEEALAYTSKFCLNKIVEIDVVGKDRKGIRLGIVRLRSGKQLNTSLLKSGLAWYSHHWPLFTPCNKLVKD